jgi:hypothetical protein
MIGGVVAVLIHAALTGSLAVGDDRPAVAAHGI